MQITETLHIIHCSKSLYTNITPFFPTLQADPSDSANDTETGAVRSHYLYFFKRSCKTLRGFLIAAWAGAKITERLDLRYFVI